LQLQRPWIALPDTYATPRRTIRPHPLFASCLPCDGKIDGDRTACVFSIFVQPDFIGIFRPALFRHPQMIHPIDF